MGELAGPSVNKQQLVVCGDRQPGMWEAELLQGTGMYLSQRWGRGAHGSRILLSF